MTCIQRMYKEFLYVCMNESLLVYSQLNMGIALNGGDFL